MEKEKLITFNHPFYASSMDQVKALAEESGLFHNEHMGVFESSWDPLGDNADSEIVFDCIGSGANVTKFIRAVMDSLMKEHFGEAIIDNLFLVYTTMVARHLQKVKAKYPIIVVFLKTNHYRNNS